MDQLRVFNHYSNRLITQIVGWLHVRVRFHAVARVRVVLSVVTSDTAWNADLLFSSNIVQSQTHVGQNTAFYSSTDIEQHVLMKVSLIRGVFDSASDHILVLPGGEERQGWNGTRREREGQKRGQVGECFSIALP